MTPATAKIRRYVRAESARVTFVIAAYNAEKTLDRTLRSVTAQQFAGWAVIIIDDGSSDRTAEIAEQWAAGDGRIQLIRQINSGASSARNHGLKFVNTEWIVFLDSDDTISPNYLRLMLSAAASAPSANVVCCGYARVDHQGKITKRYAAPRLDLNAAEMCALEPPTTIHGFMIRRRIFDQVGTFDTTLKTSEDWDLWVRIARTGTEFAVASEPVAYYWNSALSQTKDGIQMLRDNQVVRRRMRSPDPRVANPHPSFAQSLPAGDADAEHLGSLFWNAGIMLGGFKDGTALFAELYASLKLPSFDKWIADCVCDGMIMGCTGGAEALIANWSQLTPLLEKFAAQLEERLQQPGSSYAFIKAVERGILTRAMPRKSIELSRTIAVPFGIHAFVRGVTASEAIDSIVLGAYWLRPRRFFVFELPIFGRMDARTLRRLVMEHFTLRLTAAALRRRKLQLGLMRFNRIWSALRSRLLRSPTKQHEPLRPGNAAAIVAECEAEVSSPAFASANAAEYVPEPSHSNDKASLAIAWDRFYQAEDPWNFASSYEQLKYQRTFSLIADRQIGRALELGCSEGRFTELLAESAESIRAVDISDVALSRARLRCAKFGNVEYLHSDFFVEPIEGSWDLIVCSETLYYLPNKDALPAMATRIRDALSPGGFFLHATGYHLTDNDKRTGFDFETPFGAESISTAMAATGLKLVKSISTELYKVELFQKTEELNDPLQATEALVGSPLDDTIARGVVWNGAIRTRSSLRDVNTYKVPVLMYHRVGDDGPAELARWRVSPKVFEHQLRFLRRRGYRSLSMEEWSYGAAQRGVLSGRPIILSFDDAYLDFYETAWPIIYRNGFSALVFVVSGKTGLSADWDSKHGAPSPLMDWDQVRALSAQGVEFGSHLVSHTRSDFLSSDSLLRECVHSRVAIEHVTSTKVTTLAVPFGISGERIEKVAAMAGYQRLFLDDYGAAPVCGLEMRTPRIEVRGDQDINSFAKSLGRIDEPPEEADLP
jgi:GT2 family glycosyltransferase/peptidoglycan/xylan/chitin deacetylase (PgdA/CDA1 family)/2-polyprenyl-3-methyl-5-hydroxy-6-metoxy-1,4-benzoquinol methylase